MSGDHLVYVLECGDGTLYTGYTTDLERRLSEHRSGTAAKYTRGRGPFEVVYVERCEDRSTALSREATIKQLTRSAKLELVDA